MGFLNINEVVEGLSCNPFPALATVLWHFVSGEGKNKVSPVMLNHIPAYKWARIKNSILRRAFYRAINSFTKMWWKTDRSQNNFRLTESSRALRHEIGHVNNPLIQI